jgi:hypothetical protein
MKGVALVTEGKMKSDERSILLTGCSGRVFNLNLKFKFKFGPCRAVA